MTRMLPRALLSVCLPALLFASAVQAHEPSADRRALVGNERTSDPRRIPEKGLATRGQVLVLKGGRIFDALAAKPYAGTLVIEDNRIKAVLPPTSQDWPAAAEVIDVAGATVLPGLIDMHVHITYPDSQMDVDAQSSTADAALRGARNLRGMLESGVTSVRDLNGLGDAPYVLASWAQDNAIPSPRVFTAGHIITGTGGHAAERPLTPTRKNFAIEVDGADAWRGAVRQVFKDGASVIKVASHFSQAEIDAAVDEAHLLGLKVTCDCETIYTEMAVKAGIDMIEHPLPRTDETITLMAKAKVRAIPTLQVYQNVLDRSGGFYGSTSRRFKMTSQGNFDAFKKMKAAGIVMGIGTDTIGDANAMTPNIYIAELKWFVKGGYTPIEALKTATLVNARLLDMDDQVGSLEPGKLADILVVKGNPDENLDDLTKVDLVIRDGIVWVRNGQIDLPRHVARPLLKPSPPAETR